ncbi:hypothetical protein ACRALDRAFT_2017259 [Sodiomyces alcalophilus JCM 7366]|uniref:uncharacterized protein n=1 Tax=Sodiomyces alcalophilus JCM 7366 TaxID=591952 RepID=UPI0039B4CB32
MQVFACQTRIDHPRYSIAPHSDFILFPRSPIRMAIFLFLHIIASFPTILRMATIEFWLHCTNIHGQTDCNSSLPLRMLNTRPLVVASAATVSNAPLPPTVMRQTARLLPMADCASRLLILNQPNPYGKPDRLLVNLPVPSSRRRYVGRSRPRALGTQRQDTLGRKRAAMRSYTEANRPSSARRTLPAQFVSLAPHGRSRADRNSTSADASPIINTPCGTRIEGAFDMAPGIYFPRLQTPTNSKIATLGARLAIGASRASDIALVISEKNEKYVGRSVSAATTLESWGVKTIRAPKLRVPALVDCHSLPRTQTRHVWGLTRRLLPSSQLKTLLGSSSFHFQGPACELAQKREALFSLRSENKIKARPFISWEPLDTSLDQLVAVLAQVDAVFVDVHQLKSMLNSQATLFDKQLVERDVQALLDSGIGCNGQGVMVVQCDSSYLVASREDGFVWVPTFHDLSNVEASFGTNALSVFLGAFTVQFLQSGNMAEAALYGAVAESFAVEQQGLPRKGTSPYAAAAATFAAQQYGLPMGYIPDGETWNMDSFKNRVQLLKVEVSAMTRARRATLSRRLSGETLRNEDDFLIADQ